MVKCFVSPHRVKYFLHKLNASLVNWKISLFKCRTITALAEFSAGREDFRIYNVTRPYSGRISRRIAIFENGQMRKRQPASKLQIGKVKPQVLESSQTSLITKYFNTLACKVKTLIGRTISTTSFQGRKEGRD